MSTTRAIPNARIDDALYQKLMNIVGQDLAFAAVDGIWDVLFEQCGIATRWVEGAQHLAETLEIHLDWQAS